MGKPLARGIVAAGALVAACLTFAACAPAPSFEADVEAAWAAQQFDRVTFTPAVLGRAVLEAGTTGGAEPVAVVLPFASAVSDLRVRCAGGATIRIQAQAGTGRPRADAGSGARAATHALGGGEATCDRTDHVIALAAASGIRATSVTVRATSTVAVAALVVIEGTAFAGTDPWQHYFDSAADAQPYAASMSGSFGPEGNVSVTSTTDLSLAAGDHVIEFQCAGDAQVTLTASAVRASNGNPTGAWTSTDVSCPGSTYLELTTLDEGLTITADSHGATGAFFIGVDPGATTIAP